MGGQVPRVVGLAECLREWLDHRREVLLRRSKHRLAEIKHRLEILGGLLIAYLNIDAVIKIIRKEDEPKPVLMKRFKLTDIQATAILDMRLRHLRKLEEFEIRRENDALKKEKSELEKLIGSPARQWKSIAGEIKKVRETYGPTTALGRRRTTFEIAEEIDIKAVTEAMIEKEPLTVVVSEKGWVRALKGHDADTKSLSFKGDDKFGFAFNAETTSKLLVFATNGRFYTIDASKLPGGRGFGEPVSLMVDMEGAEIVSVEPLKSGRKFLVASKSGNGFVVKEEDCLANTRKGKQVLNVKAPDQAAAFGVVEGDHVAAIGENRKMVIFSLKDLPEMGRGKGVRLQRYKDGGLSDAKAFTLADGLTWIDKAGRTHTVEKSELRDWIGNRADAGRLAPKGFPESNTFK
jgi:topoisomerase-4 subunit A